MTFPRLLVRTECHRQPQFYLGSIPFFLPITLMLTAHRSNTLIEKRVSKKSFLKTEYINQVISKISFWNTVAATRSFSTTWVNWHRWTGLISCWRVTGLTNAEQLIEWQNTATFIYGNSYLESVQYHPKNNFTERHEVTGGGARYLINELARY